MRLGHHVVLAVALLALGTACGAAEAMRLDVSFQRSTAGEAACTRLVVHGGPAALVAYLPVAREATAGVQSVVVRVEPGQQSVDVELQLFRATCDEARSFGGELLAFSRGQVPVADVAELTLR